MGIDKDELLTKLKELLKDEVSKISYDTWINPLGIRSIDNNHIIFTTVSEYQKDFIENYKLFLYLSFLFAIKLSCQFFSSL